MGVARGGAAPAAFAVAVLAVAVFSWMDAVLKELVLALGTWTALFWRTLAATALSGAIYAVRPRTALARGALRIHLERGAVSTAMMVAFFWGLARVPMAQAVALTFIAPLLSLFLAAVLLGERVTRRAVAASCIGLAGVAVILGGQWRGDFRTEALRGSGAILGSAVLYAYNIVLMRRQALVAGPVEVAFSQSAAVTALLAIGAPWFVSLPEARHVPMLLVAAALGVAALLLFAWAYARSDATRLSTSEYTAFVWAALLGFVFFGERLDAATLAGAALIVVGCVLAARHAVAPPTPPPTAA